NSLRRVTAKTVLVAALVTISLAREAGTAAPQQLHASYQGIACFAIGSDPTGGYLYGPDGSYWGKTSDTEYVAKTYNCGYPIDGKEVPCEDFYETLTAKKPGYKSTVHRFAVRYKRSDTCWDKDWQKLMVVLDVAK